MNKPHFLQTHAIGLVALIAVIGPGCQCGAPRGDAGRTAEIGSTDDPVIAIYDVLSIDSELGIIRNQATETRSLAAAIREYVASIDSVDFGACPADFAEAFRAHRNAWEESIPFFERFPDLRGEMHELFEQIRRQSVDVRDELERTEVPIWDTWREVEAVAADHGAIGPLQGD